MKRSEMLKIMLNAAENLSGVSSVKRGNPQPGDELLAMDQILTAIEKAGMLPPEILIEGYNDDGTREEKPYYFWESE